MLEPLLNLYVVLPVVLLYLATGIKVARSEFQRAIRRFNSNYDSEALIQLEEKRVLFKTLPHKSYCNLTYSSMKSNGCNCDSQRRWLELKADILRLESGEPLERPKPSAGIVFGWPITLADNYIRSGADKLPDYQAIARQEKELLP